MGLIDRFGFSRLTAIGLVFHFVLALSSVSAQSTYPATSERVRCYRRINRNGKCRGEVRPERLNSRVENDRVSFYDCCRTDGQLKGFAFRLAVEGNLQCQRCPRPRDGRWSPWTAWTLCSVTCGRSGTQRRERRCNAPPPLLNGQSCKKSSGKQGALKEQETRECGRVACPVHGGWTKWSAFSTCSVTCGIGKEVSVRKCENPKPANGGRQCEGNDRNIRTCVGPSCVQGAPLPNLLFYQSLVNDHKEGGGDEKWHPWSRFSRCSKSCGIGTKTRSRTCKLDQVSGVVCTGAFREEHYCQIRPCNQISCQRDGGSGSGSGSERGEGSGDGSGKQDFAGLSDDEDVDIPFVACCKKHKLTYNNKGYCCPDDGSSGEGSGSGSGSGSGDDNEQQQPSSRCVAISEYKHKQGRQRRDTVSAPAKEHHRIEHHVAIRKTVNEDHIDEDYADDDLVLLDTKKGI